MFCAGIAPPHEMPHAVLVRPWPDVAPDHDGRLAHALRRLGVGRLPDVPPEQRARERRWWAALDDRPHACASPGRGHERFAACAEPDGTLVLLRARDVSFDQEERAAVWVQAREPAADRATSAGRRTLARTMRRARELEADAAAALAVGDRAHRRRFPGNAHAAYAAQLHLDDRVPVLRLLRAATTDAGGAARTVIAERRFPPDVAVGALAEAAAAWAARAASAEAVAYARTARRTVPARPARAPAASAPGTTPSPAERLAHEAREDAAATVAAARRALDVTT